VRWSPKSNPPIPAKRDRTLSFDIALTLFESDPASFEKQANGKFFELCVVTLMRFVIADSKVLGVVILLATVDVVNAKALRQSL
jgi:hypothetical protein